MKMNREIKFRCWDGHSMIYPTSNGWYNGVALKDRQSRQDVRLGTIVQEGFALQYTGLKDKNGKEIYEGDILHTIAEAKYGYMTPGLHLYRVVAFGRICVRDESWNAYHGFHCDGGKSIEGSLRQGFHVVGNIYENPDLLK